MRYFLISTCLFFTSCGQPDKAQETKEPASGVEDESQYDWNTYKSGQFNFSLEYPQGWKVHEGQKGIPLISIYNPEDVKQEDLPLTVHADASLSYVSFFPEGWGTELPSGRQQNLKESTKTNPAFFKIDVNRSKVFMLEEGEIWAYLLYPLSPPAGWSGNGFVFAQAGADSVNIRCFDRKSGRSRSMEDCNPLMGDSVTRTGKLSDTEKKQVEDILNSVRFTGKKDTGSAERLITDLIRVSEPEPNQEVTLPLTVKGEARGYWYFEGSFPVLLQDEKGRILIRVPAQAEGEWMTEDFVPFTVTLNAERPVSGKAFLIFQRANPSGLAEHDLSLKLPVVLKDQNN